MEKHKLNSIIGTQDLRIIEDQYCQTFKGSKLSMHVSFEGQKRDPPLPFKCGKMRGGGGRGRIRPPSPPALIG